jgi:hypothetical protein
VLPGVTVEASSPALIERARIAVTDGEGRYNVTELRPGTYTVAFTLPGFSTIRREGIVLTSGFTAAVNAELTVGGLEETLVVTGESPLVDTTNVRRQEIVSSELLDALPTGTKHWNNVVQLTPGLNGQMDVQGQYQPIGAFHGKSGTKIQFEGMSIQHTNGSTGVTVNGLTVAEMTLQTSGISAESNADGAVMNMVLKEGGNEFRTTVNALYTNDHLQANNLNDELRSRGLTTIGKLLKNYDVGIQVGGPIKKDKAWFYAVVREWGNANQVPGGFWNSPSGSGATTGLVWNPDLSRPATRYQWYESMAARVTWQASTRNKFGFFADVSDTCQCRSSTINDNDPPEARNAYHQRPAGIFHAQWSNPLSSRVLLEGQVGYTLFHWPSFYAPGVTTDNISVNDASFGFRYNARSSYSKLRESDKPAQRFSVSYVTGSHAFKVGFNNEMMITNTSTDVNQNLNYTFRNGVPTQLTMFGAPYTASERSRFDMGIYAQDQWAFKRLTFNYGLRFDYFTGYTPAKHVDAQQYIPFARDYAAKGCIPCWKDLSPRLGVAYNVFGNGNTAVKWSIGKYVAKQNISLTQANNPLRATVISVNRAWTDSNRNLVPDCDLRNPAAQNLTASGGDNCGALLNNNFGKDVINTTYTDDVLKGWGVRGYNWDMSAEVQQQLGPSVSVSVGSYRNWFGNFTVSDNTLVGPSDYSPYSIIAPVDSRLPGGGGYQINGFYDLNPNKVGQVNNVVVPASKFGDQSQVNNFFNVGIRTRLGEGLEVGGGIDTGTAVTDNCAVTPDSPQKVNCRVKIPFEGNTQVKMHASYPLPYDFVVAATFQNLPGPNIIATYAATNAEIAPSLSRNLSSGSTASVPLITPGTVYEPRVTRLDLRLGKVVPFSSNGRIQANVDLYNVLNSSDFTDMTTAFGARFRLPFTVLDGRLLQFGLNVTF